MAADPIVIVNYARTPMGGFQGALAGASATELGAAAVKAAVVRSGAPADQIDQIVMGSRRAEEIARPAVPDSRSCGRNRLRAAASDESVAASWLAACASLRVRRLAMCWRSSGPV